jgi:aromatic-L-amino-acid decarboxylase
MNDRSPGDAMTIWEQVGREIDDFISGIRTLPVATSSPPAAVRHDVESRFDFTAPIALSDLTRQVAELMRRHAVHVTHPRYFGLFNPSVSEAAIVADTLAALYNPQLAAWSHAPAANELERLTLRHLSRAIGFDPDTTFANFTTGGLEANLSAVVVALAHRFPEYGRRGAAGLTATPTIYVTSESHHSFVKICRITGLGTDSIREVPTTSTFTMAVEALRALMDQDARSGRLPFFIVGTAGSTAGGVVDPLAALADVAEQSRVWLHIDAAWGGAATLVPRLRPALAGIERADSVTWDAHKWLSVPMGAGMFFCRHTDAVRRAFDVSTSYMPSSIGEQTNEPYLTTLQWSRRAIGLKLFMSMAERGAAGLSGQIDHQARMGDALRTKLQDAGWVVVNETMLPVVCVTHDDIRTGLCTTGELVKSIQSKGRVWISEVFLGGREHALRACVTSFRTDEEDIDVLVSELEHARLARQRV